MGIYTGDDNVFIRNNTIDISTGDNSIRNKNYGIVLPSSSIKATIESNLINAGSGIGIFTMSMSDSVINNNNISAVFGGGIIMQTGSLYDYLPSNVNLYFLSNTLIDNYLNHLPIKRFVNIETGYNQGQNLLCPEELDNPQDASQYIFIGCKDLIFKNWDARYNSGGITLVDTNNAYLLNNSFNNIIGIEMYKSSNFRIINNSLSSSAYYFSERGGKEIVFAPLKISYSDNGYIESNKLDIISNLYENYLMRIANSNNLYLFNNNLSSPFASTSSTGIYILGLYGGNNIALVSNTININGNDDYNSGLRFNLNTAKPVKNIRIINNSIFVKGTRAIRGMDLRGINDSLIENNTIFVSHTSPGNDLRNYWSAGIYIAGIVSPLFRGNIITDNNVAGFNTFNYYWNSLPLSSYSNFIDQIISTITIENEGGTWRTRKIIIENSTYGKVTFLNPITAQNIKNFYGESNSDIVFGRAKVSINLSEIDANVPITITLYNVTDAYGLNIYKDGDLCSDCASNTLLSGALVSFNASGIGSYEIKGQKLTRADIESPINGMFYSNIPGNIIFTKNSYTNYCWFQCDNEDLIPITNPANCASPYSPDLSVDCLSDGQHNWSIIVSDQNSQDGTVGDVNRTTVSFYLNQLAPQIFFNSPTDEPYYTKSNTFKVNVTTIESDWTNLLFNTADKNGNMVKATELFPNSITKVPLHFHRSAYTLKDSSGISFIDGVYTL